MRHVRCVDPANATAVQGEGVTDSAGDFTPSPVAERLISTADVRDIVENSPDSAFLIDVRATNEYNGDAPFGSGGCRLHKRCSAPVHLGVVGFVP